MKLSLIAALAAVALAGCADPFAGKVVTLDVAAGGANVTATSGLTLGYTQASGHFVPVLNKAGTALLTVNGPCGTQQIPATYGILAGNASASVQTSPAAAAAMAAGSGQTETVAVAANRMSSTGDAAVILAEGGGAAPSAAVVTAHGSACPPSASAAPAAPAS